MRDSFLLLLAFGGCPLWPDCDEVTTFVASKLQRVWWCLWRYKAANEKKAVKYASKNDRNNEYMLISYCVPNTNELCSSEWNKLPIRSNCCVYVLLFFSTIIEIHCFLLKCSFFFLAAQLYKSSACEVFFYLRKIWSESFISNVIPDLSIFLHLFLCFVWWVANFFYSFSIFLLLLLLLLIQLVRPNGYRKTSINRPRKKKWFYRVSERNGISFTVVSARRSCFFV